MTGGSMNQSTANVLPRGVTIDVDAAADRVDAPGSSQCADEGHVRCGHRGGHVAMPRPNPMVFLNTANLLSIGRDSGCDGAGPCPTPRSLNGLRRGRCTMSTATSCSRP